MKNEKFYTKNILIFFCFFLCNIENQFSQNDSTIFNKIIGTESFKCICKTSKDSIIKPITYYNIAPNVVVIDFLIFNSSKDTLLINEKGVFKVSNYYSLQSKQANLFNFKTKKTEKGLHSFSGFGYYVIKKSIVKSDNNKKIYNYLFSPMIHDSPFISSLSFTKKLEIMSFDFTDENFSWKCFKLK